MKKVRDILIVDDEADIRSLVRGILEDEGYTTREAATSEKAYSLIEERRPDLLILDIWLEGSGDDGLAVLEKVKAAHPFLPVLMISGHGTIETAVTAIKQGAYDFIEKPFKADRLLLMIERALETAALRRENETLKRSAENIYDLSGESQAIKSLRELLKRVAATNSRVLITGGPGSGKDLAARFIHRHSARADKPFLVLNCATLRPDRFEVEIFGSEDGVMGEPGKTGLLERADGGILILDEIADMPLEVQGKILRVLQEQPFRKVGGKQDMQVDVRIIAVTNRELQKEIAAGRFREDLFYRLNVVPVAVPPLARRREDIPGLAALFAAGFARKSGLAAKDFSQEAVQALQSYAWPGNVRQLRNVVEWVMIVHGAGDSQYYIPADLPPEIAGKNHISSPSAEEKQDYADLPLREAREMFEKEYLIAQIRRFGGNVSKTAEFIGMDRSAFHRKLKSLNVTAEGEDVSDSTEKKQKRA